RCGNRPMRAVAIIVPVRKNTTIYESAWWSVEIPISWRGTTDEACVTFRDNPEIGVLQISAARKDNEPVIRQDLEEFERDRLGGDVSFEEVNLGAFSGLTTQCVDNGLSRQEWWLASGPLMIYVTYNVRKENEALEKTILGGILRSLRADPGVGAT